MRWWVSVCVSTRERNQFPSVPVDRSGISPFRINHLQTQNLVTNNLCPDCSPTLSASPHILTELAGMSVFSRKGPDTFQPFPLTCPLAWARDSSWPVIADRTRRDHREEQGHRNGLYN